MTFDRWWRTFGRFCTDDELEFIEDYRAERARESRVPREMQDRADRLFLAIRTRQQMEQLCR